MWHAMNREMQQSDVFILLSVNKMPCYIIPPCISDELWGYEIDTVLTLMSDKTPFLDTGV